MCKSLKYSIWFCWFQLRCWQLWSLDLHKAVASASVMLKGSVLCPASCSHSFCFLFHTEIMQALCSCIFCCMISVRNQKCLLASCTKYTDSHFIWEIQFWDVVYIKTNLVFDVRRAISKKIPSDKKSKCFQKVLCYPNLVMDPRNVLHCFSWISFVSLLTLRKPSLVTSSTCGEFTSSHLFYPVAVP